MAAWDSHQPRGQLRKVLETILQSELFRTHGAAAQKAKTPLEFAVSAVRALRAPLPDGSFTATLDGASLPAALDRMGGMKLFDRGDPDGYPESASPWISAGTLAERLRYVQSYCLAPGANGRGDSGASACAPVTLLKQTLPAASWKDAGAVVDFFLGLVLPGEGRANLDLYRTELIRYLNTADDGVTASGFSGLADTSTAYDIRVRGMVAMLLSSPRFQEQ